MLHELKVESKYFRDILFGLKKFEVRYNDRDYNVGDFLIFKEINSLGEYTGFRLSATITYVLSDERFLKQGYVAFGFEL